MAKILHAVCHLARTNFKFQLSTTVLNPNEMKMESLADLRKFEKYRNKKIPAKDIPEDHPMLLEIRRRLIGAVEDLNEFGFL